MHLERLSHQNTLRSVAPSAKGIFALSGLCAAFLASTPFVAGALAALFALLTLGVARVSWRVYLAILVPALFFLALSAVSLALSLAWGDSWRDVSVSFPPHQIALAALVCTRSLASLCAMLFLTLTTPLGDMIALLRRCRTPELLIDILVLGYRSLFVMAQVVSDTRTAQASRLGYVTNRRALSSLGVLIAHATSQLWHRAGELHTAALARAGGGALRFADHDFPHAMRDGLIALLVGGILNSVVVLTR